MRRFTIVALLASWVACVTSPSIAAEQNCGVLSDNSSAPVFALQHGRFGCPADGKYALIFHSGVVYPHSDLRLRSGVGWTTALQATFPIKRWPRWGWDVGGQYSHFPGTNGLSAVNIVDFSGNLSFAVLRSRRWLFVNAGPGGYHLENQGMHFGFNAGGGMGLPIRTSAVFELTYNYHSTVDRPVVRFSSLQGGVVLNPQPLKAALAKWATSIKCRFSGKP